MYLGYVQHCIGRAQLNHISFLTGTVLVPPPWIVSVDATGTVDVVRQSVLHIAQMWITQIHSQLSDDDESVHCSKLRSIEERLDDSAQQSNGMLRCTHESYGQVFTLRARTLRLTMESFPLITWSKGDMQTIFHGIIARAIRNVEPLDEPTVLDSFVITLSRVSEVCPVLASLGMSHASTTCGCLPVVTYACIVVCPL